MNEVIEQLIYSGLRANCIMRVINTFILARYGNIDCGVSSLGTQNKVVRFSMGIFMHFEMQKWQD